MEDKDLLLVLRTIKENPNTREDKLAEIVDTKINHQNFDKYLKEIWADDLIERGRRETKLTKLGNAKLEELEKEFKNSEELKKLTRAELKGNVFQLKYWWLILLANAIISIIISMLL